jgi:hypothetical protein
MGDDVSHRGTPLDKLVRLGEPFSVDICEELDLTWVPVVVGNLDAKVRDRLDPSAGLSSEHNLARIRVVDRAQTSIGLKKVAVKSTAPASHSNDCLRRSALEVIQNPLTFRSRQDLRVDRYIQLFFLDRRGVILMVSHPIE